MCVEERREMRNQLRRYDYVLDFVEPNVITGWFVGRLHCFASARRPASVIRTRATLIDLPQLFPEDCGFFFEMVGRP